MPLTVNSTQRSIIVNLQKLAYTACQWLGNVDIHMFVKCDKNIPPCGEALSLTANRRTDVQTDSHIVIIVKT